MDVLERHYKRLLDNVAKNIDVSGRALIIALTSRCRYWVDCYVRSVALAMFFVANFSKKTNASLNISNSLLCCQYPSIVTAAVKL
jgi:hypothetical protein